MDRANGPARARELLGELHDIIFAEGFASLRIGAAATRLKCSRTTIYKLAPSKDALILLVLGHAAEQLDRDLAAAVAAPGLSAAEKITAHLDVVRVYQDQGSALFWRDVAAWEPAGDVVARARNRAIGVLRGHIESGIESGEFRPMNATLVADIIAGVAHTSHDGAVTEPAGLSSSEAIAEMTEFLIRGMRADRP